MDLLYDLMQGQLDIRFTDSDTTNNAEDNNVDVDVSSTETAIEAEIEMILNH